MEAQEKSGQELNEILRIRRDKLKALIEEGKNPYEISKFNKENNAAEILADFDAFDGKKVVIAGRLMSKRVMGKASFAHVADQSGKIQMYVQRDVLGEDDYKSFKTLDIGDIVGVKGEVFKTKTGETSIKAEEIILLSKSLQPLPEKFHGLKDPDLRYRMRYVDLIMNAEVKDTFVKRSQIIKSIRETLDSEGYLEVETPVLNTIAGGAAARPFVTHHNALDIDMYMRIAPELYLKRLIVGGFERVYEMGRQFRNEGMDIKHNPEFTSIEMYEAYGDYERMMELCEKVIVNACQTVCGTTKINYQGQDIDLTPPFRRITMNDAVKEQKGADFCACQSDEEARELAKSLGLEVKDTDTRGKLLSVAFEEFVEDNIVEPTFVMDYPVEISPLAKRNKDHEGFTDRFELFMLGREMANAFSELNDPIDQKERFEAQVKERENGDDEAHMMDEDFVLALEYAMPPTGGMGIGVDRLVMLLTDSYSIRDVILFPTMKPVGAKTAAEAPKTCEKIDFSKVKVEPLFEDMVDFETFSKSDFRAVKVKDCVAVPKSKKLLQFTLDDGSGTDRTILSGIHEFYEPEQLIGKTCIAIVNLPPRKMMGIDSCGMLISAVHEYDGNEGLNLLMVDSNIPAGAKLY